jgi:hypothetical protein
LRHTLTLALVASALFATAGTAAAGPEQTPSQATPSGRLVVSVQLHRFVSHGRRAAAEGTATATLTGVGGAKTSIKQKVTLAAATGSSCKVLHLFLQQLDLELLGLNAHLDKVQLDITGTRSGGVLGRLFCQLSQGVNSRSLRAANAALATHPARAMYLQARIAQQQAAPGAPVCQVLDLILGPLDLNLLGLEVDLNRVHLAVTATPGGGVLGDLFCRLSTGQARPRSRRIAPSRARQRVAREERGQVRRAPVEVADRARDDPRREPAQPGVPRPTSGPSPEFRLARGRSSSLPTLHRCKCRASQRDEGSWPRSARSWPCAARLPPAPRRSLPARRCSAPTTRRA